jgi:hypothetical protein
MSSGVVEPSFVTAFRKELRESDPRWLVQKYILSGNSQALSPESYHDLRAEIADWAGVHVNDVVMVGSGKLGFSTNPDQLFKAFHDESDLDMAIISSRFFDYFWRRVFLYSQLNEMDVFWKHRKDFYKYLIQGWMRPDLLPTRNFEDRGDWWTFFGRLSNRQNYGCRNVSAGIYKTWDFLEAYQTRSLSKCKLRIVRGK